MGPGGVFRRPLPQCPYCNLRACGGCRFRAPTLFVGTETVDSARRGAGEQSGYSPGKREDFVAKHRLKPSEEWPKTASKRKSPSCVILGAVSLAEFSQKTGLAWC